MSRIARLWMALGLLLLTPACATQTVPGAAVEVKVPIPVPCQIEQVPTPEYPVTTAREGMSIWELSKIVTSDRRVRMAENERLRAAINNPCPVAP